MTLDETMLFNNMTNAIKNLEQSKSIRDIIDDLNDLILTLGGRKHDIINEVASVTDVYVVTVTKAVPVSPPCSPAAGPSCSQAVGGRQSIRVTPRPGG